MANTKKLLDLPNELLIEIFGYLSCADLIHAFIEIRSNRLKDLIKPFVQQLDVKKYSIPWIQHYFPLINTAYEIHSLCLRDEQLETVCPLLISSKIKSIQMSSESAISIYHHQESIEQLTHQLARLSIDFDGMEEDGQLAPVLFNRHSTLEHLAVRNCHLFFDESDIRPSQYLKSLHIEIEGTHHLFLLLKNLRALEYLEVKFISNECIRQPDPVTSNVQSCPRLHNIDITGHVRHFNHLGLFFATFGRTFVQVRINITTIFSNIDGKVLGEKLLERMPSLQSLELFIHSSLNDREPRNIETFRTTRWQQFSPIAYYFDDDTFEHTICMIPFPKRMSLSNSAILSWQWNRPTNERCFGVQELRFNVIRSMTLHSCQFIRDMFPRLHKLIFTHEITVLDEDDYDLETELRSVNLMANCLLMDNTVELPTVRHVSIKNNLISTDTMTLYRLLKLLPNLTHLELSGLGEMDDEDLISRDRFSRIRSVKVKIRKQDQKSKLHEYLSRLFPNAQVNVEIDSGEDDNGN